MGLQFKKETKHFYIRAILLGIILVLSFVGLILGETKVLTYYSPIKWFFLIFTFGVALTQIPLSIIGRDGAGIVISWICLIIGAVLLMQNVKIYITIILVILMLLLLFIFMAVVYSKSFLIEKDDKKEGYVPYNDQVKARHEKEQEQRENYKQPELKSFRNEGDDKLSQVDKER